MSAKLDTFELRLAQVDDKLAIWRDAQLPPRPAAGWVATVRQALGMSGAALARRVGMTPNGVRRLELAEADQAITLASLHKLANVLGCELQYALVPRKPLAQLREARALELAQEEIASVAHTMALEDQSVSSKQLRDQVQRRARALLNRGPNRDLW